LTKIKSENVAKAVAVTYRDVIDILSSNGFVSSSPPETRGSFTAVILRVSWIACARMRLRVV
jgi:hypothetical protein